MPAPRTLIDPKLHSPHALVDAPARASLCLKERLGVLYRHTGARPHDSAARPDRSHLVWKMPALPPQVGVMCNLNHPKL